MITTDQELQKLLEKASALLSKAQKDPDHSQDHLTEIIELFRSYAKEDTSALFFLGTMYMPKINHPFPDDYETAVKYFMQVKKSAGIYWNNACGNIGMYYYKVKQDYLRAAAYFSLAVTDTDDAGQVKNYYQVCLSRISNRSFWIEQMKTISVQSDVEAMIGKGIESLTIHCPYCKSTTYKKISLLENFRTMLGGKTGLKRYQNFKKYRCCNCGQEWI